MNRNAAYAASLDPITNGHIDVIERMAPLYDTFYVIVAVDSRKNYTFTVDERVAMAKNATAHIPNVSVTACVSRYVVKVAQELGAKVLVRGLRNIGDFEAEFTIAKVNRDICPEVETVFCLCNTELMHVSSSLVKSLVGADPNWETEVAKYTPEAGVAMIKEKHILAKARKHWDNLMAEVGTPKENEIIYGDLIKCYNDPSRGYHNLEHIVSMLDEFEEVKHLARNPIAVKFAIWYHDAVYETQFKYSERVPDNEARSTYRAEKDMDKLCIPSEIKSLVCSGDDLNGYILATRHGLTPTEIDPQIIVDLDLAILGKSQSIFDRYETGIRNEYLHVPEADYRSARLGILSRFLNRKQIYCTEFFQNRYESSAYANLRRSIWNLEH